jgi:hypothetical protein
VRISTLLIEPVPTACPTLSGTKYSKRSDFVARVTLRVAFGGGGVSCWLFYIFISSLLAAPLSVGPHVIRALHLRGAIEYYEVASKIRFTDSIVEVHEQTA